MTLHERKLRKSERLANNVCDNLWINRSDATLFLDLTNTGGEYTIRHMKSKTLLIQEDGATKKVGEGDLVMTIQANRIEQGKGEYRLDVNIDWSFDSETNIVEIKSMLGGFLGNIEDVFGEKMVTEMISHWGVETGKVVKDGSGKAMVYARSKGQKFKKGGE